MTRAGRSRRGTSADGTAYLVWERGPRVLLVLQGGPGSALPGRLMRRLVERRLAPYLDAGYTVCLATRRRHMPPGHTIADMADDHARLVDRLFAGRVDVVVGESYGGLIAQQLAARHPHKVGHVVLVASGCEVSDRGKDVDARFVAALTAGRRTAAAVVFAEYLLPGANRRRVRRLLGPLLRPLLAQDVPRQDLVTELDAELAFDGRPVLPRITAPVLLVAGDRDLFFPPDVVAETAALIPHCTLVGHPGAGHLETTTSRHVPHQVLAFVDRAPQEQAR